VSEFAYRMQGIVIAIGPGEYNNTNFRHAKAPGET